MPTVPVIPSVSALLLPARSQAHQHLNSVAPPAEPDWIDMISFEFLENHPAFVKPPPSRHGVPEWDTTRNPSIDELLESKQGVRYHASILCPF